MTTLSLKKPGGTNPARVRRIVAAPSQSPKGVVAPKAKVPPLGDLVSGIVVWFRDEFGFLRSDGGQSDKDYFAHKNELENGYIPKPNDRVTFYAVTEGRKLVAKQISQSNIETVPVKSSDLIL